MTEKPSIDERTGELLNWMAQHVSRRGLLAKVGNVALKIAGLSLVPVVLPVDRAHAQFGCSGDWQLCGFHGYFCQSCCGHGPRYWPCPSCTYHGAYWEACCGPNNCECAKIRYTDCCAPPDHAESLACKGSKCGLTYPNPPTPSCPYDWPEYCTGGMRFRCTVIYNTGIPCQCFNNGQGGCIG